MLSEPRESRRGSRLQFSLKSLMFLMSIVAVCAALVSISPVLAIGVIPFILMAAARTALVHSRTGLNDTADRPASGLFITFSQSLMLILALTVVSVAALAGACAAACLIAMTIVTRALQAAGIVARACAPKARQFLGAAVRGLRAVVSGSHPAASLNWFRARAVEGTMRLFAASRRLLQQCWHPDSPTLLASTESDA